MTDAYSIDALRKALREFQHDLRDAGKALHTVHTYTEGGERFIRYLEGTYSP